MKYCTVVFEVYKFSELSYESQNRAINDLVEFYMEAIPYEELPQKMKQAVDKAERLHTPWFAGAMIWEACEKDLRMELDVLQFLFNGELFAEADYESSTYPLGSRSIIMSHGHVRAIKTGEFRAPKAGEYYLSGAIPEAWKAPNDLTTEYHICRLVRVEKVQFEKVFELTQEERRIYG